MLGSEGGDGRSVTCRIGSAWKKFRELLPLLTSRVLSIELKGRLYESCVRSVMLYGSETWAVKQENLDRLERNDMRMVRWMCNASLRDRKSSDELRSSLCRIKDVIQIRRLNWLGHLERMKEDNWVRKCRDLIVPGAKPRGTIKSLHFLTQLSSSIPSKCPSQFNLLIWITSLILRRLSLLLSSSELFLSLRLALHIHLTILISFLSKRSKSSCFTAHVSLPYNITLLTQASYNLPFTSIDRTLLVNKGNNSLNIFQAEPILQVTLLPTPPSLPNISPK
ncbi:uncharacterized protein LOC130623337 [Hydractinia symbiolongicarpus]|uniref:uncharacterized protein LOC130623337 n=1 Tax=Hydractinia symbiolongicarpus TaxID=13093 RepID=UPI00254FA515|nr:uncharacterized protein LOC130623337 [Hydractinia symbiolongicarpus]